MSTLNQCRFNVDLINHVIYNPGIDMYKCSFFPQTIRDWNSLADFLTSAAECAENPLLNNSDSGVNLM